MAADSLEHAIAARDVASAETVLRAGARARPSVLVALARNGWWACVRLALEHGAGPDEPSEDDGELPLIAGASRNAISSGSSSLRARPSAARTRAVGSSSACACPWRSP